MTAIAKCSMRALYLMLACCVGAPAALPQELVTDIIQLRYRTVEQVLPVLQPLVPRPGTVSGFQSSLIVRTTQANLADVRRILESIDRMPRRLMITVRQDADGSRDSSGFEVSGRVTGPAGRVEVPGSRDDRGVTVERRSGDDRVRARVFGTQALENDRSSQQVQVLEGNEAFIRVGQSAPVPTRSVVRTVVNGRIVEQVVDSVEYRDAITGFHVRPRLAGDTVTLDVSPQRDTPGSAGPGSLNVQRVSTTVSGRLGEWIEIGGLVSGRSQQASGTVYRTQTAGAENRRVLVRVEELP